MQGNPISPFTTKVCLLRVMRFVYYSQNSTRRLFFIKEVKYLDVLQYQLLVYEKWCGDIVWEWNVCLCMCAAKVK